MLYPYEVVSGLGTGRDPKATSVLVRGGTTSGLAGLGFPNGCIPRLPTSGAPVACTVGGRTGSGLSGREPKLTSSVFRGGTTSRLTGLARYNGFMPILSTSGGI